MCDERERLIGYVYGECDVNERRAVDRHLADCETCREEIGGLQAARHDLLAWKVPEVASVWGPFAPARITPWWRQVPAWAMAAAAGAMFLFGAAGSLVTQSVFSSGTRTAPGQQPISVTPASSPSAQLTTINPGVTPADLEALERRVMAAMRSDLDGISQRVRLVSAHGAGPATVRVAQTDSDSDTSARVSDLISQYIDFDTRLGQLTRRTYDLEKASGRQNSLIQSLLLVQPAPQSGGGNR